ncbi:MAG: pitrilysin family protein [Rikenellaceae bacterium]
MKKEFQIYTHPATSIRCIHRPSRSNVAYLSLLINSGTRDEIGNRHGVAHLTEHLLFKGTQRRNAFHISNSLESRGGDLNAYTTKEETVLHACCLKSDFSRALELLVDMCFNSRYAQKELEAEREIIYDEINSYKDSPAELIFDDFEEQLFAGSSLGRNILGDKRQLSKLTRGDILDYTSLNFTTDRIVISSSANISFERFMRVCDKILEPIAKRESNPQRIKPETRELQNIIRNKRTHQQHTIIGGYGYDLHDKRRIPLSLLTNIIAGPFSLSLLNQSLREKNTLTYNVESGYTPYSDSGVFTIYYGCEAAKNEQATAIIEKELKALRTAPISSGKFNRFKRQFLGQLVISNDNSESLTQAIAKSVMFFGDYDSNESLYKKVESLTAKDIMEVAAEILDPTNQHTLTYQ